MTSRLKPIRKRTSSGRAPPVLGGERVGRELLHAHARCSPSTMSISDGLAPLVALGAGQPALLGPAAVAVHHQRDVVGHELGAGAPAGRAPDGCGSAAGSRRTAVRRTLGCSRRRSRPSHLPDALRGSSALVGPPAPPAAASAAARSRCHCRCAATRPLHLAAGRRGRLASATAQSPCSSASIRPKVAGAGVAEPGRPAVAGTPLPRPATLNARCGPGRAAARAVGDRRRPAGEAMARSRKASSTSDGVALAVGQRPQRAEGQQVQPQRRLALLGGEPLGGLGDRAGRGVAGVVADDAGAERVDGLAWVTMSRLRGPCSSCTSTWSNGSSRAPNRDRVRRTPFATARTRPCRRVSRVTIRSASPSFCTRSTTGVAVQGHADEPDVAVHTTPFVTTGARSSEPS